MRSVQWISSSKVKLVKLSHNYALMKYPGMVRTYLLVHTHGTPYVRSRPSMSRAILELRLWGGWYLIKFIDGGWDD